MNTPAPKAERPPRHYARRLVAAALDFLIISVIMALLAIAAASLIGPDRLRLQGGALSVKFCQSETQGGGEGGGTARKVCDIRPLGMAIGYYTVTESVFTQDGTMRKTASVTAPSDAGGTPVAAAEVGWLLTIALFLTLWPWWDARSGTPGKRALRLSVVTADGAPAPYWRTMVRTVVKLMPIWASLLLPPLLLVFGTAPVRAVLIASVATALLALFFWLFFAGMPFGTRPGPHDRWAGTRVIRKGL